ncbi:hypothetical protein HK097_000477 [Rhizophlyctis rosea]|uniref:Heterokaryon incompatibility domain-containing protein n=1 Tax=Rhizophlyctis rosea TaxID=64517 RepID=A0AAD5X2J4_9FUNG|nr:hypothetical protein HK097_000477 [Rhizophlyctis rosea]
MKPQQEINMYEICSLNTSPNAMIDTQWTRSLLRSLDESAETYQQQSWSTIAAKRPGADQRHHFDHSHLQFWDKLYQTTSISDLREIDLIPSIPCEVAYLPNKLVDVEDWQIVHTSTLSKSPSPIIYCAISYTWDFGLPDCSAALQLSGLTWPTTSTTLEGYQWARNLAIAAGFRYLWMDALCMDQSVESTAARMREATRMCEYYSRASTCFVFLENPSKSQHLTNPDSSIPKWFQRVWTLQEAWLPIQCIFVVGSVNETKVMTDHHMYWHLSDMKSNLPSGEETPEVVRGLDAAIAVMSSSWMPTPTSLRHQLSVRQCTYETDRVNGVLGLAALWADVAALPVGAHGVSEDILAAHIYKNSILDWALSGRLTGRIGNDDIAWQRVSCPVGRPWHAGHIVYQQEAEWIGQSGGDILVKEGYEVIGSKDRFTQKEPLSFTAAVAYLPERVRDQARLILEANARRWGTNEMGNTGVFDEAMVTNDGDISLLYDIVTVDGCRKGSIKSTTLDNGHLKISTDVGRLRIGGYVGYKIYREGQLAFVPRGMFSYGVTELVVTSFANVIISSTPSDAPPDAPPNAPEKEP